MDDGLSNIYILHGIRALTLRKHTFIFNTIKPQDQSDFSDINFDMRIKYLLPRSRSRTRDRALPIAPSRAYSLQLLFIEF